MSLPFNEKNLAVVCAVSVTSLVEYIAQNYSPVGQPLSNLVAVALGVFAAFILDKNK